MKDKWDKLTNLVDEYECVEGLDKKAIEQIKENKKKKRKKKFSWKTLYRPSFLRLSGFVSS